ncbi:hypothetical protein JHD48_08970 [Sulfurimonas sp. SAG-AH-194-I05]|nr:hypothetical protein [Sulfurimonas sp. SAG-AH-194-I05]MDF1875865.1 hypothetical protein [Sulfurimonas sp. SAG-AH-194-I05]
MHIKRYTIASLLLIAFVGWYVSTFVSSENITINLFGIVISSISISIWVMIPLLILYVASVIHMSFYSVVGSFKLRKYEKDYEKIIDCMVDAYLGKENRSHIFKTPRYKLLGTLIDNAKLFPTNLTSSSIEDAKISETIKLIESIKNGDVVDMKKMSLESNNPLVMQNNRNKYKSELLSAEDILGSPSNYDASFLKEVYTDFVKEAKLTAIENYKSNISLESLYVILDRINCENNTIEVSNALLIELFKTLEIDAKEYIKISSALRCMLPEQRMKLFEIVSSENDIATDAYLYTLFDLEMLEPANAILNLSQNDEYINFKAYSALKGCNKNFNINLFV